MYILNLFISISSATIIGQTIIISFLIYYSSFLFFVLFCFAVSMLAVSPNFSLIQLVLTFLLEVGGAYVSFLLIIVSKNKVL